jgi:hypothetical protein
MAAIDISNRRCRQFVGIDVVEQCNLDCVENAAHHFQLTTRRRANATNPAKVELRRRPGPPRRRPLIVRLGFDARDESEAIGSGLPGNRITLSTLWISSKLISKISKLPSNVRYRTEEKVIVTAGEAFIRGVLKLPSLT